MQEYFQIDIFDLETNNYFDTLPFNFESVADANNWINNNTEEYNVKYKIVRVTKEYI